MNDEFDPTTSHGKHSRAHRDKLPKSGRHLTGSVRRSTKGRAIGRCGVNVLWCSRTCGLECCRVATCACVGWTDQWSARSRFRVASVFFCGEIEAQFSRRTIKEATNHSCSLSAIVFLFNISGEACLDFSSRQRRLTIGRPQAVATEQTSSRHRHICGRPQTMAHPQSTSGNQTTSMVQVTCKSSTCMDDKGGWLEN